MPDMITASCGPQQLRHMPERSEFRLKFAPQQTANNLGLGNIKGKGCTEMASCKFRVSQLSVLVGAPTVALPGVCSRAMLIP
jgi:hypothetical protein